MLCVGRGHLISRSQVGAIEPSSSSRGGAPLMDEENRGRLLCVYVSRQDPAIRWAALLK